MQPPSLTSHSIFSENKRICLLTLHLCIQSPGDLLLTSFSNPYLPPLDFLNTSDQQQIPGIPAAGELPLLEGTACSPSVVTAAPHRAGTKGQMPRSLQLTPMPQGERRDGPVA